MAVATDLRRSLRGHAGHAFGAAVALVAAVAACANTGSHSLGDAGAEPTGGPPAGGMTFSSEAGAGHSAQGIPGVTLAPLDTTVTVTIAGGMVSAPKVQFTATSSGQPVDVGWSVDRGEIGTITSAGLFTPTGTTGGTADVIAGLGSSRASTTITVILKRTDNGFTGPIDLTPAGGYGGVGGEGPGGPLAPADVTALQRPPASDPMRTFLYPYDKTVWPRGLLAPLLQWTEGRSDATALAIHLESKTFVYDGYFGRPAALASTAPFVRHPIPQDVWHQATESTSGTDALNVSLAFLAGGATVGPLVRSWTIAPAILEGTVYYESYGTELVQNSDFTAQDGSHVGAAVLAIKPGDTGPHVVAGTSSPNGQWGTGCRACHSVAARGSRLLVQDDTWPYGTTSLYDLQSLAGAPLVPPGQAPAGTFAWAGLSPDGRFALTNGPLFATGSNLGETQVFQIDTAGAATELTVAGLPAGVSGATPVFSPDGRHVAFTHVSGTLGALTGDGTHVVALDFDSTVPSMSGAKNVFTLPSAQGDCVGFPSFLPTNDSLLVDLQLQPCNSAKFGPSYVGTTNVNGEIWWTDVAGAKQHRLDALNGNGQGGVAYLPTGPSHAADATLNYEPTVNPAASGGYAWVIFTSRRLYGNVATIDPFSSDPRSYDYAHQVTTKKLWVAAIDLNAAPGTDPSHPAFYLPAQELRAGNARGYWVLDPCRADGADCQSGDQCCGGYCQPVGADDKLVCADQTPTCSQVGEKCARASDCCDPAAQCINGFCATPTPPPAR